MDILAARKRAAERAKAEKPAEKPQVTLPAEQAAAIVVPGPGVAEAGQEGASAASAQPAPELPTVETVSPPPPETIRPGVQQSGEVAAREGATTSGPPAAVEPDLEMLSVLLGREEYAIPVDRVREVLSPRETTPVPHTPEYILGVCSLRGAVLPIIDLKLRLGLARTETDEKTRIVVAGVEDDDRIGLLVDRVRGVVRFPAAAIRPVPETVEQGAEFLAGIVRQEDRLIILLDVHKATAA